MVRLLYLIFILHYGGPLAALASRLDLITCPHFGLMSVHSQSLIQLLVSAKNRAYYDIFYRQFCTLVKQFHISFEFLAIGVETVLEYARPLEDTVAMSRNISAWIINSKYKASIPIRHDRYLHLDDINADLYECSS